MRNSLHHPLPPRRRGGRSARLLAGSTLAIGGCLALAAPAWAEVIDHTATTSSASSAARAQAPGAQAFDVPAGVGAPQLVSEGFTATPPDVPKLLQQAAPRTDAETEASTAAALGPLPGERLKLVGTALSYLGAPYVLGGASLAGIDCSGLTMQAYATVGVSLAHYVPTQDDAGHAIPADQAKPGDLVVFDDEEHVGVYLGAGKLVAAPAPGREVEVEPLGQWSGIPYHFTRILAD